ncbi:MAG: DMT family transporter [Firmicutes bacterium]|nr:DMT family transporter [Bacillota bacterium]
MKRWQAISLLVVANIFWAGNFLAGRILRFSMGPFTLNGIRWIISALILLIVVRISKEKVPLRKEWRAFLWLGTMGMVLFSALTYWGLTMVPAGEAGLLAGFTPIAVLVAGVFLAGDAVRPLQWGMVGVSLIGEVVLLGIGSGQSMLAHNWIGPAALILATIAWGIYTALSRRYRFRFSPLVMTAGAAVWGAVPSAVLGAIDCAVQPIHLTMGSVLAVLYVSSFASVAAFIFWVTGVKTLGSGAAAPFINLIPVFTAALAVLFLHEQLAPRDFVGGALIIAGALGASLAVSAKQGKNLPGQSERLDMPVERHR